jgi:hypothetical protein
MDETQDDCFEGLYEYIGEDPNAEYDDAEEEEA